MQADMKWMGHPDQGMQVRRFRLAEGREDGLECIEVQAGSGLSFTVVPGHGMSLQAARYRGVNLSYLPPGGSSGPGMTWQMEQYFEGGLMFTCGLDSTGQANGPYGLHGMLRRLPAQDVTVSRYMRGEFQEVEITGCVIQSGLGMPTLILERKICCSDKASEIRIHDRIRNTSGGPAGWMIMYHFNLGWPLLGPNARLYIPSVSVRPKNETAAAELKTCMEITEPQAGRQPQAFYHSLDPGADKARVVLENPDVKVGVAIETIPAQLPCLTQWRNFRAGEYVLGLEPCNVFPMGRTWTEENHLLPMLEAGEERSLDLTFQVWSLNAEKQTAREENHG